MKNFSKARIAPLFRIIALVAVIGFSFATCSDGGGGGGGGSGGGGGGGSGSGGVFKLTDIPSQYNGMYAYCQATNLIWGWQSRTTDKITLPKISNGSVSIPLWKATDYTYNSFTRYSDNGTGDLFVAISDTQPDDGTWTSIRQQYRRDIDNVTFSNGNATKSWNDGY